MKRVLIQSFAFLSVFGCGFYTGARIYGTPPELEALIDDLEKETQDLTSRINTTRKYVEESKKLIEQRRMFDRNPEIFQETEVEKALRKEKEAKEKQRPSRPLNGPIGNVG